MTPDPYRIAYDSALADLTTISERYEQLSIRKRLVENLISALQPVFAPVHQSVFESAAATGATDVATPQEITTDLEEPASEAAEKFTFLDVPAPLPQSSGDPFERRAKASFRFRGLSAQRSY